MPWCMLILNANTCHFVPAVDKSLTGMFILTPLNSLALDMYLMVDVALLDNESP